MSENTFWIAFIRQFLQDKKQRENTFGIGFIDHLSHEHPLILVETRTEEYCYGCRRHFSSGEQGYGCSSKKCGYKGLLHEECAALPIKIRHAMHPHHILIQKHFQNLLHCAVCERYIWRIGYKCKRVKCEFQMHIRCAQGSGVMDIAYDDDDDDDEDDDVAAAIQHPGHPEHELRLFGGTSLNCNACGIARGGKSFICSACEYWIHERCISLPQTMKWEDHNHSLTLSFRVPYKYIKSDIKCNVCNKYLLGKYWIYHCEPCRYAVHIKCTFKDNKSRYTTRRNNDEKGNEIEEEEILHHWSHEQRKMAAADDDDEQGSVIQHPSHPHQLRLRRSCSFMCNVCGITPGGRSYACIPCEYWIHRRCASLLLSICTEFHHHPLSLSFGVPPEYIKFRYKCDVCDQDFMYSYGVYHCQPCRFVVHTKGVFNEVSHHATMKNSDERGSEIEEEAVAEEILHHWSHWHPLTLAETRRSGADCYGCERHITSGEQAYVCSKRCGYQGLLHEECAEMSRKIRHPIHLQHILIQKNVSNCSICKKHSGGIGYTCTSSGCDFQIHIRCALDEDNGLGRSTQHPSHPQHELRLLKRSCSFRCDACGTKQTDTNSYVCITCQYWIHRRCAFLPPTMKREDHHHVLSLSFCVPPDYIRFDFKCEVCRKDLLHKYWIYHCALCRYAVHIKCAFNKSLAVTRIRNIDEEGIIQFPVNDVAEEQIQPFVMSRREAIAPIPDDLIYEFYSEKHQLRLVASSSSHGGQNEEENSDDEDDYGQKSKLICDGCTTPIFQKQRSAPSSSSNKYYYMSCSECKYFLHLACFLLPPQLPSLPLHHQPDHDLLLKSCDKLKPWEYQRCSVCDLDTNGLIYACTRCSFVADVKCASMAGTIYHAAHPQHPLKYANRKDIEPWRFCAAGCNVKPLDSDWYVCKSCEFSVHVLCAVLPPSTTSRRWDKNHPLPLTYDANLNHPGDFCCDECEEEEMNPKMWMYHCRHCDLSFHPSCFKTTSGEYRNIKFGDSVNALAHPPHPLTYQLLTTKRCCDVCGEDRHEWRGFHCALCNFFICFSSDCGVKMLRDGDIQAVD